jgi:hypothetical protein
MYPIRNVILCPENVWNTLKNGNRSKEIDYVITNENPDEMAALIARHDPITVIIDGRSEYFGQYILLAKANCGTRFVMLADKDKMADIADNIRLIDADDLAKLESIVRETELKNITCKVRYEEKCAELADRLVLNTLGKLGFRLKSRGTMYLHEIIMMMLNDELDELSSVVKETYPEIAKRNNTTVNAVERNVRVAINSYWDNNKCVECLGLIAEPFAEYGIIPDNKETILNIYNNVSGTLKKESSNLMKKLVEETILR